MLQELLISGVDTIIRLVVHIYVTVCGTIVQKLKKSEMACKLSILPFSASLTCLC
jgi:hypothetical protein